jgi:tryptophan-rich sensory protein
MSLSAFGPTVLFTMLVFSLGAFVDDMFALFNGWSYDGLIPDWANQGVFDVLWFVVLGMIGVARWRMRRHWQRWLLDGLWAWCIVYQVLLVATGSRTLGAGMAIAAAVVAAVLASRIWMTSRGAAMMLVPLGVFLLYRASTLM